MCLTCEETKAAAANKVSPLLYLMGEHSADSACALPLEMGHHIFSSALDYTVSVVTTVVLARQMKRDSVLFCLFIYFSKGNDPLGSVRTQELSRESNRNLSHLIRKHLSAKSEFKCVYLFFQYSAVLFLNHNSFLSVIICLSLLPVIKRFVLFLTAEITVDNTVDNNNMTRTPRENGP